MRFAGVIGCAFPPKFDPCKDSEMCCVLASTLKLLDNGAVSLQNFLTPGVIHICSWKDSREIFFFLNCLPDLH